MRADARRNYERLVVAAREVFAQEGGGASMEAIARRAGVGVGTLYRHFPNRIDIVEAVYRTDVDNLVHTAEQVSADLGPWPAAVAFLKAFVEYAQSRGFVIDPARVRTPTDKPRVERVVHFTRNSMFAGETFLDLGDAQRHAEGWCRGRAGLRTHGTTQCRPAELFALEEQPRLLPAPTSPYDLPVYATAKVHRDHHIEVARAIYSIPGNLIGQRVEVRADRELVRVFHRGQLVKVHPRTAPGGRVTDPADLPAEKTTYALRDIDHLRRLAAEHGPAIGAYAAAVLDHPLPWTKMRQTYALLGLVKRWGPERVEAACARALEAEAISVALIGRMIERATEGERTDAPVAVPATPGRFERDPQHFATTKPKRIKASSPQLDLASGGVA